MNNKILILLMACLPAVAACGEESPSSPEMSGEKTILSPRLLVIPESDSISVFPLSDSLFNVSFTGSPPEIKPRHILAGTGYGGYLREVERVERTDHLLRLFTIPSRLTEVIRDGVVRDSIPVAIESGNLKWKHFNPPSTPLAPGGIYLGDIILFSGQNNGNHVNISITGGYLDFNPLEWLDITVSGNDPAIFRSRLTGEMDVSSYLDIEAGGEVNMEGEIPVASFRRTSLSHTGELPVTASVSIFFRMGYQLSTGGSGRWRISLQDKNDIRVGMEYLRGSWDSEMDIKRLSCGGSAECESSSGIDFEYYISTSIKVSLYSVRVSSFNFNHSFEFDGEVIYPPVTEWILKGQLEAETAFYPSIVDRYLEHLHNDFPLSGGFVISGPYSTDYFYFVRSWGEQGNAAGQFSFPSGMDVDANGNLYVCDTENHRIQKFTGEGEFLLSFGGRGVDPGNFNFPCDAAVGPDGSVYVLDNGNNRIQKFNPDTTLAALWGNTGSGEGEFNNPYGIAVDGEGNVYVTDCHNHNIQKFSQDGGFIDSWGSYGTGEGKLYCPMGITFGPDDTLYVAECQNHRIQKFSTEGASLRVWGGEGEEPGQFNCPIDLASDQEGNIYVLDNGNSRMQMFDSGGDLITVLGGTGTSEGEFDSPEGIVTDRNGYIFISDTRNNRIQKYFIK